MVKMILCIDENGNIGKDNDLLCGRIPFWGAVRDGGE